MDPTKRNCLFQPVVPYEEQVRKKKGKKKILTAHRGSRRGRMGGMFLFILFSFLTDFLRKCEQMSFRLESPASLCKNDLCQSSNFRHIRCLEEDSGPI